MDWRISGAIPFVRGGLPGFGMSRGGQFLAWICLMLCGRDVMAIEDGLFPLPRPPLEEELGTNLYWHIPGIDEQLAAEHVEEFLGFEVPDWLPTWYVVADLQTLKRDNQEPFPMTTDMAGGPAVLSADDLSDEFEAGARLVVGRSLGAWYRIEGVYWGGYAWSDTAAVRNFDENEFGSAGNLFSILTDFGNPAIVGLDYNDLVRIDYSSRLQGGELNIRRRMTKCASPMEVSFLVGARYMRIEETFGYRTESAEPPALGSINQIQLRTDNDMFGAQVGLLSQWLASSRCWIDFEIKGGIFSNLAELDSEYSNTDQNGATSLTTGSDEATKTAFMLDLSLMLNHQFTPHLTFRVGYYAMWLSGVALGPDNLSANADVFGLGPVLVDDAGRAVFHGPGIGLVGAW